MDRSNNDFFIDDPPCLSCGLRPSTHWPHPTRIQIAVMQIYWSEQTHPNPILVFFFFWFFSHTDSDIYIPIWHSSYSNHHQNSTLLHFKDVNPNHINIIKSKIWNFFVYFYINLYDEILYDSAISFENWKLTKKEKLTTLIQFILTNRT